jgi:exonuclease SbcC
VKIKRLEIKNWIGLSELSIDLGKINFISGKKGSGKTSLIEAIQKVFTNKNQRSEVVRHGNDEATIYLQTDDGMEIDRRIRTDKGDYLKIKKPGEAVPQTETYLRKLINGEIFRPLEFIQKSPDEQAKIILNMLEIPWTMEDIKTWFGEIPSINFEAHILKFSSKLKLLTMSSAKVLTGKSGYSKRRCPG